MELVASTNVCSLHSRSTVQPFRVKYGGRSSLPRRFGVNLKPRVVVGVVSAKKQQKNSDSESEKQEKNVSEEKENKLEGKVEEEEEYEEETWLEEKLGDAYEYTASVMEVVPGPRVGAIPWLVAIPAGYLGISFAWAIIKLVLKYNSSTFKKKRLVGRNLLMCQALDEYLPSRREELTPRALSEIRKKFKYPSDEVLRKYIRYALNERPFTPEAVADLIHLRKLTNLPDEEVVEVLNEISRRVVKSKGPIVMDTEGMTEKGIKRKAAVQGIFTKLYYLSEVEEFVSGQVRDQLLLKETFGITDEDTEAIRIESLSQGGDTSSLERLMESDGGESDGSGAEN